jgi:hypothetical protein
MRALLGLVAQSQILTPRTNSNLSEPRLSSLRFQQKERLMFYTIDTHLETVSSVNENLGGQNVIRASGWVDRVKLKCI